MDRLRNVLAWRIANFALDHIATKNYRDMIDGSIRYGMNSAARDARKGWTPPPHWSEPESEPTGSGPFGF